MKKQLLLSFSLFYFSFTSLNAQAGSLDVGFDSDGIFTTPISTSDDDRPYEMVVQPDGKIIIAGYSGNFGISLNMIMMRLNSDGSLDPTFNGSGLWTFGFGTGYGKATSVLLQDDGKIILGGYSSTASFEDFTLIRLNSNGMFDNSFDGDGIQIIDFPGELANGTSAVIQNDGKIVLGGEVGIANRSFALTRSNSDGSIDSSFGVNGKTITPFNNGLSDITKIAIQSDGKIIAAGNFIDTTIGNYDIALARYNTNGSLDSSFGLNGKSTTDFSFGTDEYCWGMDILPDGSILTTGAVTGFGSEFVLAKFKTNGTLDSSFGNNGLVAISIPGAVITSNSVCVQPDNKILLGGNWNNGSGNDFALMRLNLNGTVDSSFNATGFSVNDIGSTMDFISCLAIQPDLKIVAAGITHNGSDRDFAVARYLSGLNLGIVDLTQSTNNILVYPNPIMLNAKLEYTLEHEEKISIELLDANGKLVANLVKNQKRLAGNHQELIQFPPDLTSGVYYLILSNSNGMISVKVVK